MSAISAFLLVWTSPLWVDAREVKSQGLHVDQAGDYTVWAWTDAIAENAPLVMVGDIAMLLPKPNKVQSGHHWRKLGTVALRAGKQSLELDKSVATVVIHSDSKYDPAKVMKDMRVYDQPRAVVDRRALYANETNTVFTFPEYSTREEWETKAEELRRRLLLSSGLWPLPKKTPLKAKIFDRVQHGDYSVEKVHFEAWPGFLVTGNLYRPVGDGPFPGIFCPHGHWSNGRLEDGDRGSVPARGITLARMGAVVFMVDMVGYNDSQQFKHRFDNLVKDGISIAETSLWGTHPFATQLWAGVRSLDFLESLPDVNGDRLGATGASGGGTQTFTLMSIDPRVKVAAPVNMISSTMQGGCLCENAPLLRLDNSNMEFGALMAPRPMLLVSATGDWTKETPHVEFPAIRSIYELYGAANRLENVHIDAGHNYNKESREAMYRFFGKHLINPSKNWSEYTEPDYALEALDKLKVFPDGAKNLASNKDVYATIQQEIQKRVDADLKKIEAGDKDLAMQYRQALSDTMHARIPNTNDLSSTRVSLEQRGDYVVERWVIGRAIEGDAIPAILYRAYDATPQDTVIIVRRNDKKHSANRDAGGPNATVQNYMNTGKAVLLIDPFLTGEYHSPTAPTERLRVGPFMDTFQPTDTAYRVQDVLTAISFVKARRDTTDAIDLVGFNEASVWVRLAAALDPSVRSLLALNGPDSLNDKQWVNQYYIPSIRTIGDLRLADVLNAH